MKSLSIRLSIRSGHYVIPSNGITDEYKSHKKNQKSEAPPTSSRRRHVEPNKFFTHIQLDRNGRAQASAGEWKESIREIVRQQQHWKILFIIAINFFWTS